MDRLLDGAGEDPAVMVHIGTNDNVRGRWNALQNDFRDLGTILKKRTSKAVFSEMLPVPGATPERQQELGALNKWLRNWCRKEGFGFLENWADFSYRYWLYTRDGLHLNEEGAALLGEKMTKKLEELQVETPPKYQRNHGNNSSSKDGGKDTGKNRQILVVGDSIIRGTERAICHKDRSR